MTTQIHWDPFNDLRNTMDRVYEEGFSRPWRLLTQSEYQTSFPVDISQSNDAFEIDAALPGIRPEDVDISVTGEVVTIKASNPQPESRGTFYHREIAYGTFQRSFSLPVQVEADKAEARYEHGMLHLRLPKADSVRPRQIRISTGNRDGNHLLS